MLCILVNKPESFSLSFLSEGIPQVQSDICRTMQTTIGGFGGKAYTDGITAPPLMNDNVGDSGRPAISSLNCPPFIAIEQCRDIWYVMRGHLLHIEPAIYFYLPFFNFM
ncbi:hypothetical protein HN873_036323 [Arachis hypogaea]